MTAAPVSRREFRTVFAGLMLALTLAGLDQNIVSTALPQIVSDLGGLAHLSWVVTAFLLASTTTTPLYGKLSDMYGRKALFIVAIAIFLAGSALCGVAASMAQLIVFRGVQGLGAGGLITLAQTTVGDLVSPRERGRYQGLFAGVFAVCSVAGPLLGGIITDALSWRWIFYVNLPVGGAALGLIALGLRPQARSVAHRVDFAGAVLLMGGTTSLLLVLSWGGTVYPWSSPPVLGLGVLTVLLFLGLAIREMLAPEPILPPQLFTNDVFVVGAAAVGISAMALMGAMVFLPLFFQLVIGATPTEAGLMIAPLMGGLIVSSVVGGRLVSASGRYKIYPVIGLGVATLAYLGMAWVARNGLGILAMEVPLIALGAGLGLVMPNLTVAIQNAVDRSDLGAATSAAAFFRSLGGAVGVAMSGALMTAELNRMITLSSGDPARAASSLLEQGMQGIAGLPEAQRELIVAAYRHAITVTFVAGAAVAAVALLVVLFLRERPLKSSH